MAIVCAAWGCGGAPDVPPAAGEQVVERAAVADAAPGDAAPVASTDRFACDDPCLLLRDTPLDQLGQAFAARCGKPLLPNNQDCGLLDYERNCIYAAHGMRFRKKKWAVYATRPWYKLRPEFRSRELTQLERDNVHELRLRAQACRANDVHVSTADFARIQQWFAGYAKGAPAMPAVALSNEDRVTGKELTAALRSLNLRLEKETWMAYHDPERAVKAALAGAAALRDVIVDLSPKSCDHDDDGDGCTGPYVHFVFDGKDALVALVLTDH